MPTSNGRHGLPEIVRAFKSFSARRINEMRGTPGVPVWQRDYYEPIIRSDYELTAVRRYIESNPMKWQMDLDNPQSPRGSRPPAGADEYAADLAAQA